MPASLPSPPVLGFSFTSFQSNNPTSPPPGASLDAEFNRGYAAIAQILTFLGVSLNADGTLNTAAVQTAYSSGTGGYGYGTNLADAPSAASAALAQAWAEYLPGELPAATLATAGIVGDHWSARYWANQALLAASLVPNMLTTKNLQTGVVGLAYPHDATGLLYNNGTGTLTWALSPWLAGGTYTGPVVLAADPTAALGAATKQYVDAETARATTAEATRASTAALLATTVTANGALQTTGGALTGTVYQTAPPAASDVSTKLATTGWAASAGALGNIGRNRLHNPCMDLFQRGSGLAITAANPYVADRWMAYSTSGTGTAYQYALGGYSAPNQIQLQGVSMATGQSCILTQRIESVNAAKLVGQQVTVSLSTAYTSTAGTVSFSVALSVPSGAGNDYWVSPTTIQIVPFTPSGTPGVYTAVFNALPAGAAHGIQISIMAGKTGATGTLTWTITGVQLEPGAVASPLEIRDFGYEMLLCQRYYTNGTHNIQAYSAAGGTTTAVFKLPVAMWTPPTITVNNTTTTNVSSGVLTALDTASVLGTVVGTAAGAIALIGTFTAKADL